MITIFNRREVCQTFDVNRLASVRQLLAANGIDYKIKSFNRDKQMFGDSARSRMGNVGINVAYGLEYVVYVKKNDYEEAKALIN